MAIPFLDNTTITGNISGNNLRTSFNQGSAAGDYSFAVNSGVAVGVYSHAEGDQTLALGEASHAEGFGTKALSAWGHAEGNDTTSAELFSHAEGSGTVASGIASHAEGSNSVASGYGSHAEGQLSVASGVFSHAEGGTCQATGDYGHAEGQETVAGPGQASHSEGSFTVASGNSSHAEGSSTTASGNSSHAEGSNTTASGDISHAGGQSSIASASVSYAHGRNAVAKGVNSFALGRYVEAAHDRSWIWRSPPNNFTIFSRVSTDKPGQFKVVATSSGGICLSPNVGIGTDSVDNPLTVNGTISATTINATNAQHESLNVNDLYIRNGDLFLGLDQSSMTNVIKGFGNVLDFENGVITGFGSGSNDWTNTYTIVQNNLANWNTAHSFVQQSSAQLLATGDFTFETNAPQESLLASNFRTGFLRKENTFNTVYMDITGGPVAISGSGNIFSGNIVWNGFNFSQFNASQFHLNYNNLHYLFNQDYTTTASNRSISIVSSSVLSAIRFPQLKLCGGMSFAGLLRLREINFNDLEYVTCIGGYGIVQINPGTTEGSPFIKDINFPKLKYVENNIEIGGYSNVEFYQLSSVVLSALEIIGGYITIGNSQSMGTFRLYNDFKQFELPNLQQAGGITLLGLPSLSALSFPKLKKLANSVIVTSCSALRTIDLPELEYVIGGYILGPSLVNVQSLTAVSVPKLVYFLPQGPVTFASTNNVLSSVELGPNTLRYVGNNFTCNQNLFQQSVDNLLKAFARLDGTNGTVLYTGILSLAGNNSAPSYTGGVTTTTAGSNFVRTGTTVVASVVGHGHTNGDIVTFTGNTQSALNGTYVITVNSADQFQYTTSSSGNITGGGTVTMRRTTIATDGFRFYQTIALRGTTVTINMP